MPEKDKSTCLHHIHSLTTTNSATTSMNMPAPAILTKKIHCKRTKQFTQTTISNRNPPTFSLFISTDFRLKRYWKILSHSHTTELALQHGSQHAPPPVPLPQPPPPRKLHPTPKYQPLL